MHINIEISRPEGNASCTPRRLEQQTSTGQLARTGGSGLGLRVQSLQSWMRYWYILDVNPDGHSLVTLEQLLTWGNCQQWKDLPGWRRRSFKHKGGAHTHTNERTMPCMWMCSMCLCNQERILYLFDWPGETRRLCKSKRC